MDGSGCAARALPELPKWQSHGALRRSGSVLPWPDRVYSGCERGSLLTMAQGALFTAWVTYTTYAVACAGRFGGLQALREPAKRKMRGTAPRGHPAAPHPH